MLDEYSTKTYKCNTCNADAYMTISKLDDRPVCLECNGTLCYKCCRVQQKAKEKGRKGKTNGC